MDITTVKFIGLFVLIYTQNVGYQILQPHVSGMPMEHPSFIAYQADKRIPAGADQWPDAKVLPTLPGYMYVAVDRDFITIAGATDDVPNKVEPPHLTCCCTAMNSGIKKEYRDPNLLASQKSGAQIEVTRGEASVVEDVEGRRDTNFKLTTVGTEGITITGTTQHENNGKKEKKVKKLYLLPNATVIFGNTPFCALNNSCPAANGMAGGDGDWRAYYKMANLANDCKATPATCAACKDSGPGAPCKTSSCPTGNARRTTARRAAAAPIQQNARTINIDCSNSQYP